MGVRGPIQPSQGVRIPPSTPSPPEWLGEAALAEWHRVVAVLAPAGLLCALDQASLAAYAQATVEHALATRLLEAEGRIVADTAHGGRLQAHPANQLQRTAWKAIEAFGKLLGLDPSSRGRMAATAPPVAQVSGVMTRKRK